MKRALIVLSGGQDSTTCLFWAIAAGYEPRCLTFEYGQRHQIEILAAQRVAELAGVPVQHRETLALPEGVLSSTSPLVSNTELEQYAGHASLPGGIEKTFVPLRNQLFLTIAANRAVALGCEAIVTGLCQEDFGGYPDCRAVFVDALQSAINIGGEGAYREVEIITPLMHMDKAQSVGLALSLPGCYAALAYSHTAYDGAYPPLGRDHATLLRAKGFEAAGTPDPLVLRAWREGLMVLPSAPNYAADLVEDYLRQVRV